MRILFFLSIIRIDFCSIQLQRSELSPFVKMYFRFILSKFKVVETFNVFSLHFYLVSFYEQLKQGRRNLGTAIETVKFRVVNSCKSFKPSKKM